MWTITTRLMRPDAVIFYVFMPLQPRGKWLLWLVQSLRGKRNLILYPHTNTQRIYSFNLFLWCNKSIKMQKEYLQWSPAPLSLSLSLGVWASGAFEAFFPLTLWLICLHAMLIIHHTSDRTVAPWELPLWFGFLSPFPSAGVDRCDGQLCECVCVCVCVCLCSG